jgi:hypothetical protein
MDLLRTSKLIDWFIFLEWRTLLQPHEVDLNKDSVDQLVAVIAPAAEDVVVDADVVNIWTFCHSPSPENHHDEAILNSFAVSTEVPSSDGLKTAYKDVWPLPNPPLKMPHEFLL